MTCCKTIYEICDTVPECIQTLQVQTEYADTKVIAVFTDQHGNEYRYGEDGELSTDSNGLLTITLSDNDKLLLTSYQSYYLLHIVEYTACENCLNFVVDGEQFSHLQLVVKNRQPITENYLIKLNCEENANY